MTYLCSAVTTESRHYKNRVIMIMAISLMMLLGVVSCSSENVNNSTIPVLDLDRYLGKWYEIARFDHSFERGITNATAVYSMRSDGKIEVVNSGMKNGKFKSSTGKAKTTGKPAVLRVSFFGPFYSDYRILMLSPDYSYAMIGSGSSKYLWILSRRPAIPGSIKDDILREARLRGYDTGRLIWVDQSLNLDK